MASIPNEFSQPVLYLNGGPFETTWGPYPTKEAACLAIEDKIDSEGRNLRMGKTVAIGIEKDYVEYHWLGGFSDANLVLKVNLTNYAKNSDLPPVYVDRGVNWFDVNKIVEGAVTVDNNFNIITNIGFRRSNYIAVTPGQNITFSNIGVLGKAFQFSDANKIKLQTVKGVILTSDPLTVVIPEGCFNISGTVKDISEAVVPSNFQIQLGPKTGFEPYRAPVLKPLGNNHIEAQRLSSGTTKGGYEVATVNDFNTLQNTELVKPVNLYDINSSENKINAAVMDGGFVLNLNINSFKLSPWVALLPNTMYTVLNGGGVGKNIQYTDASKVQITTSPKGVKMTSFPFSFITPFNCYGGYFTTKLNNESVTPPILMLVQGNGLDQNGNPMPFTSFEKPYIKGKQAPLRADTLNDGATMSGKKILTVGDSTVYEPIPENFTNILAFGNSIDNGIGATSDDKKWRNILQVTLTQSLGRAITVVNGGVNGRTTTGMRTNAQTLITQNSSQIAFVNASINDAKEIADGGNDIATTESNLREIVAICRSNNCIPIICTAIPLNKSVDNTINQQKRSNINTVARKVAKDMGVRLSDLDKYSNNDYTLLGDGLHPNDKGHLWIANVHCAALFL